MELKNIFKMTKTDRYTQDGRDQIAKLQETEDVTYKTGDISQKTGLQKQPDGSWAPPKKGGAKKAKSDRIDTSAHQQKLNELTKNKASFEERNKVAEQIKAADEYNYLVENLEKRGSKPTAEMQKKLVELKTKAEGSESKPTGAPKSDNKIMNYEEAEKAIDEGKVVQWEHRDGKWHDIDPKTSALVQARDIGAKFRIKTDEDGNPIAQKPEPSQNELRNKLIELEKRRKKFEKYPDMDNNIRLQQGALLNRAGFESRAEFDDFIKSEMPTDSAPRILTGDTKIRIRK